MKSSETSPSNTPVCTLGCVFALKQEAVGLLDLLPEAKMTIGNGVQYYETSWKRQHIVVALSGIGEKKAAFVTESLLTIFRPQWLLSAGFAGALAPTLKKGQILAPDLLIHDTTGERMRLVPQELPAPDPSRVSDPPAFSQEYPAGLPNTGRFKRGTLLTTHKVVDTPEEKRRLADYYNADCVDMETWAVAQVCRRYEVPFLAVRAILDTQNRRLAKEVKTITASHQQSTARLAGALFGALVKRPSSFVDLYQLKEDALTTADALGKAIVSLLN
ncbi:MAG: hypothetical protein Q4G68_11890 [Planctomycetia bacterium]|nr:hypothetical protein [Planctomycetia bacterium]